MDTLVFAAVLLAGAMHAGWNAIIKIHLEPLLTITLISAAIFFLMVPFVPWMALPAPQSWPYIAASLAIHGVYYYGLGQAYRWGDLSHVYPIARGSAPLITAVGAYLLAGEDLGPRGTLGVLVLTSGIMLLSLKGGRAGAAFDAKAVRFALLTACAISAYTLVDGIGARQTTDPIPYIYWLMLLDGLMMLIFGLAHWGKAGFAHSWRIWLVLLFAGTMSLAAYGIAIWAMTQAPIALVAALRETSVLFGALIGIVLLREPVMMVRLVAVVVVVAGVMLVRMR